MCHVDHFNLRDYEDKKEGDKKPSQINKGRATDSHLKATAGLRLRNNGDNYMASVEL